MIAHRGAAAYAPEHTVAAYDLALEMGADYIEQDLQLSADRELVVLHDDTLDRTTGGTRSDAVGETPLAEIVMCDVGSWFNIRHPDRARPEYVGLRVPRLADVFARYSGRANFYIETKNPADAPVVEEALVALLGEYGLAPGGGSAPSLRAPVVPPTVIVQSFSAESLEVLERLAPAVPRVQLIGAATTPTEIVHRLDAIAEYACAIGPAHVTVDGTVVTAAHDHGLAVHPYTVNDELEMRRLVDAGVDGMFTDDPALLLRMRAVLTTR